MEGFVCEELGNRRLPLVVKPKDRCRSFEEFIGLVEENRDDLKKELLDVGGVLFRGFPVNGAKEFSQVIDAMQVGEQVRYIGGDSPRTRVENAVYTSTEAPPGIKISLHNEMSFQKNYPTHIFFYCDIPPKEGGETIIGDARAIGDSVEDRVRKRFEEKKLKYISRYYFKSRFMDMINELQKGHKTWIDVFETDQKEEVEKRCRKNDFGFRWLGNDWLEVNQVRPPTMPHPVTKEDTWFNQIHLYDYNPRFLGWPRYLGVKLFYCLKDTLVHESRFGDDAKISRSDIYHIHDKLDEHTVAFPWEKGDVMMLDNVLTMHGRNPFKGKRRILTAMTKDQTWEKSKTPHRT